MIVFYLKETDDCILSIDCPITDITIQNNKAYYNGKIVNNDMTKSGMVEVPKQSISFNPENPSKQKTLTKSTEIIKTLEQRIALLEANVATIATATNVQIVSSSAPK